MMNSIFSFIKFTKEVQTDFKDQYLPTLDTAIRLTDQGLIEYRFYQKEMSSKFCVRKDAALGEQLKRSVMSAEVIRRLMNTRESPEQEMKRLEILEEFSDKMRRSGYDEDDVKDAITAGVTGYERKLMRSNSRLCLAVFSLKTS